METKLEFKNVCAACGKTRRKEQLLYDTEDFKPYCANMGICNENHPNSYKNFAERGNKTVELVSFRDAADLYMDKVMDTASPQDIEVLKAVQKPTSVRISDFELAKHIFAVKEERNLASFTQAINEIVQDHLNMTRAAATGADIAKTVENQIEQDQEAKQQAEQESEDLTKF